VRSRSARKGTGKVGRGDPETQGEYTMSNPTPFLDLHTALGGNLADYSGWKLPADYGDTKAELAALYNSSAALDLSGFGRVSIGGAQSGQLVERLMAGNTSRLEDSRCVWSFICHKTGRLADIVRVAQLDDSYLILTSPGKSHAIVELAQTAASEFGLTKVKVADQTSHTGMLGIYGPNAFQAVTNILPIDINSLKPGGATKFSIMIATVIILRSTWLGVDGIELIGPTMACKMAAGAIERYHKREHIVPAGMECLEIAATEASLPLILTSQQLPEHLGPISYGLGKLVDFGKDFYGRDAVSMAAESGPQRMLIGVKVDGKAHTHKGLTVQYDGLEIGWTDRLVWSDTLGCALALAMVDNEMHGLTESIQVVGLDFQMQGELAALPFERHLAAGIWVD
jgi:aminomethyltransferase